MVKKKWLSFQPVKPVRILWDFYLCLFDLRGRLNVKEIIYYIAVAHCATYQKRWGSVFVGFMDNFLYCEFEAISPDCVVDFQFRCFHGFLV